MASAYLRPAFGRPDGLQGTRKAGSAVLLRRPQTPFSAQYQDQSVVAVCAGTSRCPRSPRTTPQPTSRRSTAATAADLGQVDYGTTDPGTQQGGQPQQQPGQSPSTSTSTTTRS